MRKAFARTSLTISVSCSLLLVFAVGSIAQQVGDPNFDVTVARPAYSKKHPRVLGASSCLVRLRC